MIETVAGTGKAGDERDGRKARGAVLNQPFGVTVAPDGDVYFCDTGSPATAPAATARIRPIP